jgi:hypothetical protein
MFKQCFFVLVILTASPMSFCAVSPQDKEFSLLAVRYMDEYPALSPVGATGLGDHRFDQRLDDVSDEARAKKLGFYTRVLEQLDRIKEMN